jgi:hypothetical protein
MLMIGKGVEGDLGRAFGEVGSASQLNRIQRCRRVGGG